jgi:hypothetical protein
MDSRDDLITAFSALGTVVLMVPILAAITAYPLPSSNQPLSELVVYFSAHRAALLTIIYLSSLAWGGFLISFAGGLWAILRRAEGGNGTLSIIAFGGCIVTGGAILVFDTIFGALLYRFPGFDPALLPFLLDAAAVANQMTAFPNAIYTIAAAAVIMRTAVLPRWIAYGALTVAAIHLLSATSLAREGAFSAAGTLPSVAPISHTLWLLAVAFVLLRAARERARANV